MHILAKSDIIAHLDTDIAMAAIAEGFVRFSRGEAQLANVGHLVFQHPHGECHIKSGHTLNNAFFVVKVATNFPGNANGSPNNGFVALVSATTGEPIALLQDEGMLTDVRTALAGAIAAKLIAPAATRRIGVVGSGVQAVLQARHIARALRVNEVLFWARRRIAAEQAAEDLVATGLHAAVVDALEDLCAATEIIVTTTSAAYPLIELGMLRPGARLVAVGADAPGKQELDPMILQRARMVIVDSRTQCLDHGEASWAARSGSLIESRVMELGDLLARNPAPQFEDSDIVVVDLTGLAIQDLQIAQCVWSCYQTANNNFTPL